MAVEFTGYPIKGTVVTVTAVSPEFERLLRRNSDSKDEKKNEKSDDTGANSEGVKAKKQRGFSDGPEPAPGAAPTPVAAPAPVAGEDGAAPKKRKRRGFEDADPTADAETQQKQIEMLRAQQDGIFLMENTLRPSKANKKQREIFVANLTKGEANPANVMDFFTSLFMIANCLIHFCTTAHYRLYPIV